MKPSKMRLLALSLGVLALIAGTAAYFTGSDAVTNTFGSATLQIRVEEPHWNNNPTIVPAQRIDKDPYIVNTDETPAYVFMQVTVPVQEITVEQSSPLQQQGAAVASRFVPLFRFIRSGAEPAYETDPLSTNQLHNAGWYAMPGYPIPNQNSRKETESLTYLYAWTNQADSGVNTMAPLLPGTRTATPLFQQVIFCNAREDDTLPGSVQNIRIEVIGIQTAYLQSSAATETQAEQVWAHLSQAS